MIAPPHQGTSSLTSTSNADFNLTVPKVEDPDLMNLSENRSSAEKTEKVNKNRKAELVKFLFAWTLQIVSPNLVLC
jgi:hypothetical protein